jgi:hypothetical protein
VAAKGTSGDPFFLEKGRMEQKTSKTRKLTETEEQTGRNEAIEFLESF